LNGLEVCEKLRAQSSVPIIMLTVHNREEEIVRAFEAGADDYVTKPFSPKVLVARIRAILRRVAEKPPERRAKAEPVTIGGIALNAARHEVNCEGTPVELSATEFAILEYLMRNPGWVFSRNQIIDAVKGKDYPVTERSVDVQILGLRKKLGEFGERVQTVRGVGYRFLDGETVQVVDA
jgi:two-component system phosphate regulon response regulator PhoB